MPHQLPTTARLEAFSDGVIAVIITIMVLELRVPTQNGLAGLRAVLPTLLIYALSFAFAGIYWINHRHLIDRIEHVDNNILYANLGFLFCLSLAPFFTGYILDKHFDSFAVALYGASNMLSGFGFLLLRVAIHRHLRRNAALTREDTATQHKHWLSLALYLIAIPTAFPHPRLALTLIATVTLIWILPTIGIKPSEEDLHPPRHG